MTTDTPSILHIATSTAGGAGGAARRLHEGLLRAGIGSSLFVRQAAPQDDVHVNVFQPSMQFPQRLKRWAGRRIRNVAVAGVRGVGKRSSGLFSDTRSPFLQEPVQQIPASGVVNLHWIADFIDYRSFFAQTRGRTPCVWTLHDMNPFTGGCHYDGGCGRFAVGCGNCPMLERPGPRDLSYRIWKRKQQVFSGLSPGALHVVAPSRWMKTEAEKSPLFQQVPIVHIPNALDVSEFAPRGVRRVRETLGIEADKKVVLFAAASLDDPRKGFAFLRSALRSLDDNDNIVLLSVGQGTGGPDDRYPCRHFGFVENERLLSLIYSAADVFVIPSLQDNLPGTVLESMACGTPVVGFDAGGLPDMVRPGETGLLARTGDAGDLARCVRRLLDDDGLRDRIAARCREVAVKEYALEVQARRCIRLYESLPVKTTADVDVRAPGKRQRI